LQNVNNFVVVVELEVVQIHMKLCNSFGISDYITLLFFHNMFNYYYSLSNDLYAASTTRYIASEREIHSSKRSFIIDWY